MPEWLGRRVRLTDAARLWLAIAAMALAICAFRLAIAAYSLWFDEQASMVFAAQPMANLWGGWMVREPNPPLYYTLLKGWIMLFGDTARAVRGLSIAAGAGVIVATAQLSWRIYGRRAALIAAGLTTLSGEQLHFSLEARGYEIDCLAACAVLMSLLAIERSWRRGNGWTVGLAAYGLSCTTCIYLHTTMLLTPLIATLALIIVRRREVAGQPGLLLPLMLVNLAIAMAAGWWLDMTVRQMLAGAGNNAVFDPVTPWFVVQATARGAALATQTGAAMTITAIMVMAVVIAQLRRDRARPETRLLAAVVGLGVAMFSLIGLAVPILLPRTIFWLSPAMTVLCAGGIAGIAQPSARRTLIAGTGLLLAVNAVTSVRSRQTEDWDGAIAQAVARPGSRLLVQGEAMGLLLASACARLHHGNCPVPIIAVSAPDDHLDRWAAGLYRGRMLPIAHIDALPAGQYFVFRKAFYHDLLKTLHRRGLARLVHGDPPLAGPIDRSALVD